MKRREAVGRVGPGVLALEVLGSGCLVGKHPNALYMVPSPDITRQGTPNGSLFSFS